MTSLWIVPSRCSQRDWDICHFCIFITEGCYLTVLSREVNGCKVGTEARRVGMVIDLASCYSIRCCVFLVALSWIICTGHSPWPGVDRLDPSGLAALFGLRSVRLGCSVCSFVGPRSKPRSICCRGCFFGFCCGVHDAPFCYCYGCHISFLSIRIRVSLCGPCISNLLVYFG